MSEPTEKSLFDAPPMGEQERDPVLEVQGRLHQVVARGRCAA